MKINSLKERIQNAVLIAERIVGKKESLPVLSCILLEADTDLIIRATNLEAGVTIRVPAVVEEKGIVAVPSTILSQTIRSIITDTLTIQLDDSNLLIESKGTKTLIKSLPHNEFPSFGVVDEKQLNNVSIQRVGFMEALKSVLYAASSSMIRPELGSVYLSIKDNILLCVATDSFRLAEKTIQGVDYSVVKDILIPLKHAVELVHVLERVDADIVRISSDDSQIIVMADNIQYVSRVVDAPFPNYKEIIPKTFTTEATVLKNDFAEMLRKARVFAGADQQVGLHVYPSRKVFSATARSNDVGEMSDTIDAAISGDDVDIKFHIGYLADCLSSINSDSIVLSFSGANRALVIKGVSDQSFLYLVMPLNR